MIRQENVSIAPYTTLHIGGCARIFIEAHTDEEVEEAVAHAREGKLSLYPLGAGSNILVPDEGIDGIVLKINTESIVFEDVVDKVRIVAGAGTSWEKIVDVASDENLFGIENLAGIPGTMGGAVVQNIGAYGAELALVFEYADVINQITGARTRIARADAAFAYRSSFFKKHRELIVLRVALLLSKQGAPNLAYPDLVRAREEGTPVETSAEIARTIRAIRAKKFPNAEGDGTAGSFFKNPIVDDKTLYNLRAKYLDLPVYPVSGGGEKISLAWILDHALSLKGFSKGKVRLYEKQPLVIVARTGATAREVDDFADEIAEKVFLETGIKIEREVETFGARK